MDVWRRFYDEEYDSNPYNNCKNCAISTNKNEIYVYESVFHDLSNGAMKISADGIKFLHSSCFFNGCTNFNENGSGAIYFNCDSSIFQHRFCTTECSASNGFHSYSFLNENSDKQNYIIECSISNCANEKFYSSIYMYYGRCGIHSSNISKNTAYRDAAFTLFDLISDAVINFSTIENNNATRNWCIYHGSSMNTHKYFICNIIKNSLKSDYFGIVYVTANLIVENCSIICASRRPTQFYNDWIFDFILAFINCNVDEYFAVIVKDPTTKNVVTTNSLYSLSHLSTYECEAAYIPPINDANISSHSYVSKTESKKIITQTILLNILIYLFLLINHS